MMFKSITYTPSAVVGFTANDLRLLMECSNRHYDRLCKSISHPGPDSFLYGWNNRLDDGRPHLRPSDHVTEETVTSGQLDTLIKVAEMARHLRDERDQKDAFGLGLKLRAILGRLHDAFGLAQEVRE